MQEPIDFSLVTYNIHKGFGLGPKRFLLPAMREALMSINPDIIMLQEVQGLHLKREKKIQAWPESPQFVYLAEETWPFYIYAKNAIYQSGHHGNAILSKFPFSDFSNINLSILSRASHSILHGQILLDGPVPVTVHLLCIHLGFFKVERTQQYKILIEQVKETIPAQAPLIIAGDFNDWRSDFALQLAEELDIQEAFYNLSGEHARSFPAIKPALRIDRIYYRGLKVKDVLCLSGKPWRHLSDHLPLFARFEL